MSENIPAAIQPSDPWVLFMQKAMTDPNFDTNKLGALLEMRHREMEQQRIERAEERKRIFSQALTAFQGEVDPIVRDAVNPFLKNRYATLSKTVDTAQPFMRKHGLNVRYVSAEAPPGWVKMGIVLGHDCGHEDEPFWMTALVSDTGSRGGKLPMTPGQAVAATMTYIRRQLYTNALNLVAGEIDDDGEGARQAPPPPRPQAPTNGGRSRDDEAWVQDLQVRLAQAQSAAGVDAIGDSPEVKTALQKAPQWVKDEIVAMLSDALARVLGPVEIPGAEKLAG